MSSGSTANSPARVHAPWSERLTAAEHLALANEVISIGDAPRNTDPERAASILERSQEQFGVARAHLDAIPVLAPEAEHAAVIRTELARREAVIEANRTDFGHVWVASVIVRASDEPREKVDKVQTARALVDAIRRFPEALRHLDAVPDSSPYAARARTLRAEIALRQRALPALLSTLPSLEPTHAKAAPLSEPSSSSTEAYEDPFSTEVLAAPSFSCAESNCCYGDICRTTGRPKTVEVRGYTRKDGTDVPSHFRGAPRNP